MQAIIDQRLLINYEERMYRLLLRQFIEIYILPRKMLRVRIISNYLATKNPQSYVTNNQKLT